TSLHIPSPCYLFFSSIDPAPTHIYTLSLHDALPISSRHTVRLRPLGATSPCFPSSPSRAIPPKICCSSPDSSRRTATRWTRWPRSEEHTSELQSRGHLVCRLLLEKKKKNTIKNK